MDDESLTMAEIEARYAPDWVLITDFEADEMQRVLSGKVRFRAQSSDEIYRKATELGLNRIAVRCLRKWPDDVILML